MADSINKAKLQLRSGAAVTSDKAPSPTSKLLINHGKPNFTIQRSPKAQQNGDSNPLSPQLEFFNNKNSTTTNNNNNDNAFKNANIKTNEFVVSSTKFNGAFNPKKIADIQQNSTENEAAKVVLRRTKPNDLPLKDSEDDGVPEFIRRQRQIQQRLAKENVLDFENRRSGYFTHVLISPTSANRTSFVETMSSPAVVPSLEMPAPTPQATRRTETVVEEIEETIVEQKDEQTSVKQNVAAEKSSIVEERTIVQESSSTVVGTKTSTTIEEVVIKSEEKAETSSQVAVTTSFSTTNGHSQEEDEVARAIEEVNKAVAGEEDEEHEVEAVVPVAVTSIQVETTTTTADSGEVVVTKQQEQRATSTTTTTSSSSTTETVVVETREHHEHHEIVESQQIVQATVAVATLAYDSDLTKENGQVAAESIKENGHTTNGHDDSDVTISHTNGVVGPSIPAADPSGALGVNFEPKTVVSFSKDLSSEPNNYPDTVKVVKESEVTIEPVSEEVKNLTNLKFEIKGEDHDVQVTPVVVKTELRNEL